MLELGSYPPKKSSRATLNKQHILLVIRAFEENRHVPNVPDSLIVSCNFDKGLCFGWSQSRADVFDWTLYSGSTPSSYTGPSSDHSGSGLRPLRRLFYLHLSHADLSNMKNV